jgi:RNA polymerase sigma factor (sigma-70 family)
MQVINQSYPSVTAARKVIVDHSDQLLAYLSNAFKKHLNDVDQRQDLLQDMYVACLEAVESYEPGRPLHCYMHQTAKFAMRRYFYSNKNKPIREREDDIRFARPLFESYEPQPHSTLVYEETVATLTEHIATLSKRDQKIVQLHLAGQTLQEIAPQVGITFQRCHQILTEFKSQMKDKLFS